MPICPVSSATGALEPMSDCLDFLVILFSESYNICKIYLHVPSLKHQLPIGARAHRLTRSTQYPKRREDETEPKRKSLANDSSMAARAHEFRGIPEKRQTSSSSSSSSESIQSYLTGVFFFCVCECSQLFFSAWGEVVTRRRSRSGMYGDRGCGEPAGNERPSVAIAPSL